MTYNKDLDPNKQKVPSELNPMTHGPARNWYSLVDAHIGTKELPAYGRSLRVRLSSSFSGTLTIVGVPIGEADDAATRTLYVDATETLPFGFRRIHSLNGGTTVPANCNIDVVTT